METISGPSQTYLSIVAAVSFALFAASRALETLRAFKSYEEDYKYLRSLSILASLTLLISGLPLALADSEGKVDVRICSYVLFVASLAAYGHVIFEIVTKRVKLLFRRFSYVLIAITAAVIGLALANAIRFASLSVYKLLVLWSVSLLCLRFYLILGVFAHTKQ